MKITPIDITHKTFSRKMWGVDGDEVSEFLTSVADELENTVKERNQLKETLREKDLSILEYRERDRVLKDTIATAQKMSQKISEDAEREARLILNDAQQKADIIVKDARDSLKRIYREISDLKRLRLQFESNFKAVIQAHLNILEQSERYIPDIKVPEAPAEAATPPIPTPETSATNTTQ
jgi:cell division initiation protein